MNELLDTAPCGFLSFSDDGTITRINATLLEMLGYGREELVGRHVERILTVGSRIFYQTHWFPLLRMHGRAEEIFMLLRTRTGEDEGMLVNAVRRERADGVGYDCVLMRVRERRKYEDELLRARRAAEQAQAELRAQKQVLELANERLEEQAVELEMQQLQLREQALYLEEASEELRVTNEHLLARTEEAEELRAIAEEANRAKSTFLTMMSHELRTPLNAIGGYVQLLEMGIHGPVTGPQMETLERIVRSQRHLLRLINDLLDLSRIEAGHVEFEIEELPLEEVVAGVVPMIEPQFGQKDVAFRVNLAPGLVVQADRERIRQILINLLGNAVKFTPGGGRVNVEAARSADSMERVLIQVIDTGIGIEPDKLDAVFQPFVQVNQGGEGASEGSGLGLAISREMARGMGGDLTAASAPGRGSTFTLSLPAVADLS